MDLESSGAWLEVAGEWRDGGEHGAHWLGVAEVAKVSLRLLSTADARWSTLGLEKGGSPWLNGIGMHGWRRKHCPSLDFSRESGERKSGRRRGWTPLGQTDRGTC